MTLVVHRRSDLPRDGTPTAVVMTMGALHAGHAALMVRARELVGETGRVIVTDFVNPRQFGPGEDFERYPRTLPEDVVICTQAGVDVVFAPDVAEVYPPQGSRAADISVDPGPLGDILEGASRPGHFRGMLTVVAKLMQMTQADIALFGEKDYQQLAAIRAMVTALNFPVTVVGVPTVREDDGLAMSSRNRYLSPDARQFAREISAALRAGQAASAEGPRAVEEAGLMHLRAAMARTEVPVSIDYFTVTGVDLAPVPAKGEARIVTAVVVDGTRLLDNVPVTLGPRVGDLP